jgi:GNAT superfamily N-acetyltransferase
MLIDSNGPRGASLHEVKSGDEELVNIACQLFRSIFPEDIRHIAYLRACTVGRHPSHPRTLDHVWLVKQDGEWVGLRIFSFIITRNFGYGAYVGFLQHARGKGLGSWLVGKVHEQLDMDAQSLGLPGSVGYVGEAERPIDCNTVEERRIAEQRLQFHRRAGALILPVPYIESVMIEGVDYLSPDDVRDEKPRPMHLLFNPSRRGREIANLDLVGIILGIYLDVYLLPRNHQYVRQSLSHLLGE